MNGSGISSHHVLWSIFSDQPKTADAVIAFITSSCGRGGRVDWTP